MEPVETRASDRHALAVILFSRTNLNVPIRFTYFFLPAIARGLGISLYAASAFVSVRSLAGIVAPLFGSQADRRGGRRLMSLGLLFLVIGAAITAGLPWYGTVLMGFGFFGLAKSAYDPAMQSYVGERVPYQRRGRALGLVELAWSGALLVMPLGGWLIARAGWQAPFLVIACLGLVAWVWTRRGLAPGPEESPGVRRTGLWRRQDLAVLVDNVRYLWQDRQARLAVLISALLTVAQDTVFVVYGAWMEDSFQLAVTALGMLTLVVGFSELTAELGVALLSDRLGKRRAVFLSVTLTACGYALLPRMNGSLLAAMAGTAILILGFEYSIVGLIPIVSGLNASARGTLMSLNVAAISAGRVLAAPLAVALYRRGDLTRNSYVAVLLCMVLLVLLTRLQERGH